MRAVVPSFSLHDGNNSFPIVIFSGFISLTFAAQYAAMNDIVFGAFAFNGNGLHQPATYIRSISRTVIDMLAPEALWAVIRVAIAFYGSEAMLTYKVFFSTLKFLSRHK